MQARNGWNGNNASEAMIRAVEAMTVSASGRRRQYLSTSAQSDEPIRLKLPDDDLQRTDT